MTFPPSRGPFWLEKSPVAFPPTELALKEPNGLLAIGGDLSVEWLLHAYQNGIFPWFNEDEPILWWTPDPRSVLITQNFHCPKSLKKTLRKVPYAITFDHAFKEVIRRCAEVERPDQDGTWITTEIEKAYAQLHESGYAHSVEAWDANDNLVGGLYGVAIGKVFFGESMFALKPDASKIAFATLVEKLQQWQFQLIDTQVETEHLNRFGAELVSRETFESLLKEAVNQPFTPQKWEI